MVEASFSSADFAFRSRDSLYCFNHLCASRSSSVNSTGRASMRRGGYLGVPSGFGGRSDLSRRTMTAPSWVLSGGTPRWKRWSSISSRRAWKLSG